MRRPTKPWPAAIFLISLLCATCFTNPDPRLYPSYDVLNPNEEVRVNPVGTARLEEDGAWKVIVDVALLKEKLFLELKAGDGFFLVNEAFLQHYRELKAEIRRLRGEE